MNPKVIVNKKKLFENTKAIVQMAKKCDVSVYAVTKVFCGHPEIAKVLVEAGVKGLADSRIENLKKLQSIGVEKWLLRLPMISQVHEVVSYADVSLNSEMTTIEALNQSAQNQNKIHKIILMVDLGDLREGVLPENVPAMTQAIVKLSHIELLGVGVNLTCYGGVIPSPVNLGQLEDIAKEMEGIIGKPLQIVSGGNSSSLYLLEKGTMPSKINQLRVGEAIVLGRETAFGDPIEGTHDDVFLLEAEVIENKKKGSMPIGEIGMDAFGNTPSFEDKGMIQRVIVAIGQQDVNASGVNPLDSGVEVLGASSDHMLLDVTKSESSYPLGSSLKFKMDYGAMLKLFTSPYVDVTFED